MATLNVGMGDLKVAAPPDQLQTILGSCVGLVLFDPNAHLAALAHIMLPASDLPAPPLPGKFADTALPALIEQLQRKGASRGALLAKIAGGAAMFKLKPANETLLDIGNRNVARVKELLRAANIPLRAEHCGGNSGRKMLFDPATGQMTVTVMGKETVTL